MAQETLEARRKRTEKIITRLRADYPGAKCSLDFTTPYELLFATILSAQCTDERVNLVTKSLFKKYPTVQAFANANLEELEQDIRSTGFYRNKAKHILEAAKLLVDRYGGEVPRSMDALLALPGVARKTANVVLGNAYGIVEGVVVDTHVGRISQRLGLTANTDPAKVEQDLMKVVPRQDWLDFSHLLIYHGRKVCQARQPLCEECSVCELCPTGLQRTAGGVSEEPVTRGKSRGTGRAK
jgi:endonuclease III